MLWQALYVHELVRACGQVPTAVLEAVDLSFLHTWPFGLGVTSSLIIFVPAYVDTECLGSQGWHTGHEHHLKLFGYVQLSIMFIFLFALDLKFNHQPHFLFEQINFLTACKKTPQLQLRYSRVLNRRPGSFIIFFAKCQPSRWFETGSAIIFFLKCSQSRRKTESFIRFAL